MPQLKELIQTKKEVNAAHIFDYVSGHQTLLKLDAGAHVKPHTSKVPAVLLCLEGEVEYQEEDRNDTLKATNYIEIKPDVLHWLDSSTGCLCLLLK